MIGFIFEEIDNDKFPLEWKHDQNFIENATSFIPTTISMFVIRLLC